jgi:hypothetical protein
MFRRTFLAAAVLLCGCWTPAEIKLQRIEQLEEEFDRRRRAIRGYSQGPTPIDPVTRVAGRLQRSLTGDGVGFDPITISILASIVCGVLKYCLSQSAMSIQRQVQRKPHGVAATRLRGKLRTRFMEAASGEHVTLFAVDADVDKHVEAAMLALVDATPEELKSLVDDVRDNDQIKTSDAAAATAAEWSRIE